MADKPLGRIAYILVLLGGILLIVFGLGDLVGTAILRFSLIESFGLGSAVVQIVLGVVALVGAKKATDLTWAIILIVVGFIAGGLGGILVLLGGVLGLISKYV